MIYVDHVHLITDGPIDELHDFAQGIGLKREWFQDKPGHPHYDITSSRLWAEAVFQGARPVPSKKIVMILQAQQQGKDGQHEG
jgi:hypothetical protein